MEIRMRKLNNQELYACNVNDIKKTFSDEDKIFINFGYLGRHFSFDSAFAKKARPRIEGIVISRLQVNSRINAIDSIPILSFFIIKDTRYTKIKREFFVQSILPEMYKWYKDILSKPETSIPGIEGFLVDWTGENFNIHCYRHS